MSAFSSLVREERNMKDKKNESFLEKKKTFLMLMLIIKEDTISVEHDLHYFPPDELIDRNLSTDDDTNPHGKKGSLKTYVESISSDSLIGDVESIDEDIREEKGIYLLQKDPSSGGRFEGLKSQDNPTFGEKIPPNTDFELQTSNALIERIKSVGFKTLKLDQSDVSHSVWSPQPMISHRSDLQSPLNPKSIDFWRQKDKVNQKAEGKIFKKRKFATAKDRSLKSIDLSQAAPRPQNLDENSDDDWEIRKIIDMRETKRGREYKVVWASTWVKEQDLKNATNLISDFREGKRLKFST